MRQPKLVLCPLCETEIKGGPSIYNIPRECDCGATVILSDPEKCEVRWDKQRYAAAGWDEPLVDWTEELLPGTTVPVPIETIDTLTGYHLKRLAREDG